MLGKSEQTVDAPKKKERGGTTQLHARLATIVLVHQETLLMCSMKHIEMIRLIMCPDLRQDCRPRPNMFTCFPRVNRPMDGCLCNYAASQPARRNFRRSLGSVRH